jgi:hypothetical protein
MALGWQETIIPLILLFIIYILIKMEKLSKLIRENSQSNKTKWYMNPWLIVIVGGIVVGIILLLMTKFWS